MMTRIGGRFGGRHGSRNSVAERVASSPQATRPGHIADASRQVDLVPVVIGLR
jgi:hypothetical protein